jgi:S1-C subfamily serine protease
MDTPDVAAPVPEDPTDGLVEPHPTQPNPAQPHPTQPNPTVANPTPSPVAQPNPTEPDPTATPSSPYPAAPIALGPVAGGWVPPSPPPPTEPLAAPAAGSGGGVWGPVSTPYGLAWGPPPIPPVPGGPKRHPRLIALSAVVVAVSVLAGVGVGYAVWRPAGHPTTNVAANGNRPSGQGSGSGSFIPSFGGGSETPSTDPNSGSSSVPAAVTAKVDPGLVDINVVLSYQGESAAGTGQVLTSSGEVLTNNHVIDGATSISAVDVGNGKTYTASVVGYDRTGDLAVIQLHGASGLTTVSTTDSSKVAVGQSVIAIGNAGGSGGQPSAAPGTVTTLNQAITASDDGGGNSEQLTGLIEVDADVQPGDSGGPLVNTSGEVVGIDTAASESDQFSNAGGNGYAIPINTALSIAKQIEAGKSSTAVHVGPTPFLGVEVGDGGGCAVAATGATVVLVAPSSPAQSAGLSTCDVITSLGGQSVTTPQSLSTIIATHAASDSVTLGWVDPEGQQHTTTVKLASGPAT